MRKFFVILSTLFTIIVVAPVHAQIYENFFPESRTVYSSQSDNKDYRLALGPMQKIQGVWKVEREEKIHAKLYRRTIEVEEIYSRNEVIASIESFFSSLPVRLLYSCEARDCGSSAAWASENFGIKQLYGLDQYQKYWVWEISENNFDRIAAVYCVQRGNKRIYVQMDVLEIDPQKKKTLYASPEAILEDLEERGYLVFSGLTWNNSEPQFNEDHIRSLVSALNKKPGLNLYLVGHEYIAQDLQQQLSRSQHYADLLQQRLQKAGIAESRLEAKGVGPLAPRANFDGARIELVLKK